jgi:hypothetical protein
MAEKAIHHVVAESVLAKVTPANRKGMKLAAKSSYTIITDASGWLARVTPKLAEFNKKRYDAKTLADCGLTSEGKDEFHRLHFAGKRLAALSAASAEGATAEIKQEAEKVPTSPGVDEIAKALGKAKKVEKKPAKPKATKSSAKGKGKDEGKAKGGEGK